MLRLGPELESLLPNPSHVLSGFATAWRIRWGIDLARREAHMRVPR